MPPSCSKACVLPGNVCAPETGSAVLALAEIQGRTAGVMCMRMCIDWAGAALPEQCVRPARERLRARAGLSCAGMCR